MGKFKKIIIITSIALNVVFVILFMAMLFKMAILNFPYWRWEHYSPKTFWNLKDYKDRSSYFRDNRDDDDDDDHHYHAKMVARDFARQVFSKPEIKSNLKRFREIHREMVALSGDRNYNEDNERRIRELFDEFEEIFLINKNIVEEEIITHMRVMDSRDRSYLIQRFLRMSPVSRLPDRDSRK